VDLNQGCEIHLICWYGWIIGRDNDRAEESLAFQWLITFEVDWTLIKGKISKSQRPDGKGDSENAVD
jgi:hypothetical protein